MVIVWAVWVGRQNGRITSSYARSAVYGGAGNDVGVGGLVGQQQSGTSTTSSYAVGNVDGGEGADNVGGLTGEGAGTSSIIASYARGAVNGGEDTFVDDVGSLVGESSGTVTVTSSYGFGSVTVEPGETATNIGVMGATVSPWPPGVTSASDLTADTGWSDADWDFRDASQTPVLKYVDSYDMMSMYTCTLMMAFLPPIAITCGTTLLPGQ